MPFFSLPFILPAVLTSSLQVLALLKLCSATNFVPLDWPCCLRQLPLSAFASPGLPLCTNIMSVLHVAVARLAPAVQAIISKYSKGSYSRSKIFLALYLLVLYRASAFWTTWSPEPALNKVLPRDQVQLGKVVRFANTLAIIEHSKARSRSHSASSVEHSSHSRASVSISRDRAATI